MTLATLFVHPLIIPWSLHLWLVLPLCAAVAVVYKTLRVQRIKSLPREVVVLWVYMLGGLSALAIALWLIADYWP